MEVLKTEIRRQTFEAFDSTSVLKSEVSETSVYREIENSHDIFKPAYQKFNFVSVQYDKYIYYNQQYAHDLSGIKSHYLKPLKTTYYLLHVSIPIGSSSGRNIPY